MDVVFEMEYLYNKNTIHFNLKCEEILVNMQDPHKPIYAR